MRITRFLYSEDAVSEVVDFVTIVSMLAISIGMIGLAGYPLVKSAQDVNNVENTKQSFSVLAANLNRVVLGQAPSSSVEIRTYGGSLSITGSSTIKITANNSNGTAIERILLVNSTMRSIESAVGDTVIAYEGTGVWVKYPNGNTPLVYKPLITNQSNVLVIPVVYINGTASTGGSGMNRVTVKGTQNVTFYGNVSDVIVTINSSYSKGWEDYSSNVMSWSFCFSSGASGECTGALTTAKNIDVYILNARLDAEVV